MLRQQIDQLDNELLDILSKRMSISREIGKYKKDHMMPVGTTRTLWRHSVDTCKNRH